MADVVIDSKLIESLVLQAVQDNILTSVENLAKDPQWLAKIEHMINQSVVQETIARIGSIDINSIIHQRIDENVRSTLVGIDDQATQVQFTIMDDTTVVENLLTAKDIEIPGSAIITNLVVKGSINTDNNSWAALSADISQKTMDSLTDKWKETLVNQVSELIVKNGIDFKQVVVDGVKLIDGNQLSKKITQTNIQSLGTLDSLSVTGDAYIGAANILKTRVGINTSTPDMALSVWDEEVSVSIGKFKADQAYLGTSRSQGLTIGVNRQPQIEIDVDGITKIKKLQIGLHKISHDTQVPGWSGTRGDIVFNSNPGSDRVFAWVCLGAYKWQPLKSAE